jgi:hypothetical protein
MVALPGVWCGVPIYSGRRSRDPLCFRRVEYRAQRVQVVYIGSGSTRSELLCWTLMVHWGCRYDDVIPQKYDAFLLRHWLSSGENPYVLQHSSERDFQVNALTVAAVVFACAFGGAVAGVYLKGRLPERHRDADSKDVVKLVMGLIATMAALVLGLLIAATHTFYNMQQGEIQSLGVDVVLLDQTLAHYGPEAQQTRRTLREDLANAIQAISPVEGVGTGSMPLARSSGGRPDIFSMVQQLAPSSAAQSFDQSQAMTLLSKIAGTRLLIHEQSSSTLPIPLVVVLVVWLTVLFLGFGLFASLNATVLAALFVGSLSVGGAVFLIVAMGHPYTGMMGISYEPLQSALAQIDH